MVSYKERTRGLVTHTKLEDFIFCPMLYKLLWRDGVIDADELDDDEEEDEKSEALLMGSAFDVYIQDVAKFNEEYAIVAKRTGTTGKIELTRRQGDLVLAMAKEFLRQPFFNPIGIKQYNVRMQWGNITLSSTPDEFQPENKLIADNKTCASLPKFENWIPKYKRQLAFAQMIEEAKTKINHNGLLRAVTKEKIPKSQFYYIPAHELLRERPALIAGIEALEEAEKTGNFPESPRSKCLTCKAYAKCPGAIQKELVIL